MKKKLLVLVLLICASGALFAAEQSAGVSTEVLNRIGETLGVFKENATGFISNAYSYISTNLVSFGKNFSYWISGVFQKFMVLNQTAIQFYKENGSTILRNHWIEIIGWILAIIGLVIFLLGVSYKPKYRLADIPANAAPLKKEKVKEDKKKSSPVEEPGFSSSFTEVINPVDVPHVEKTEAGFVSRKGTGNESQLEYQKLSQDDSIDKEDLDFFQSLSEDFENIRND